MIQRSEMISFLTKNVCQVKFTKVNGETREMICSLRSEDLPEQIDIEESISKRSEETIAVWDLEKSSWRSFKVNSVTEFRVC